MTRDQIIEAAREAGFETDCASLEFYERADRFATLIRQQALEDAAVVCEIVSLDAMNGWKLNYRLIDQGRESGADECAGAIRAMKANP